MDLEDWHGVQEGEGKIDLYDPQMVEINFYERYTTPDNNSFRYEKLEIGDCDEEELGLEVSDDATNIAKSRTLSGVVPCCDGTLVSTDLETKNQFSNLR